MSDLISKAAAIQAVFDWEQGKISGTIADAIAAIPATDARADALREAAAISEFEDDKYLILKRGMYYRPDRKGYTSSPSEAGRYTLAQAVFLTHPNGPDGPRDGMSFVPLSVALIGEDRT